MAHRLFLACAAGLSIATAAAFAAAPDPLDAKAAVPAAAHRSAFDGYRRLVDVVPVPWRQANDTVERIGGWRAYAREASQAAPPSAPAASAPPRAEPAAPPPGASGHKH
jgi:hypothetical protein